MPVLKVCDISIFAESNYFLFKASKLNQFHQICHVLQTLDLVITLPPLVPPSNTGLTGFWRQASGGLGTSFDSLQLLGTSWVIKIWVTVYVGHRFTANKLLGTRLKC